MSAVRARTGTSFVILNPPELGNDERVVFIQMGNPSDLPLVVRARHFVTGKMILIFYSTYLIHVQVVKSITLSFSGQPKRHLGD
jgi:hypothetical protein